MYIRRDETMKNHDLSLICCMGQSCIVNSRIIRKCWLLFWFSWRLITKFNLLTISWKQNKQKISRYKWPFIFNRRRSIYIHLVDDKTPFLITINFYFYLFMTKTNVLHVSTITTRMEFTK